MIELPELLVPDRASWRAWLEANGSAAPGVWLVLHKKGGAVTTLTYVDAVEEALCFGWIDGQARSRGIDSSFQRMTPRRSRSAWSVVNVGRVERLERDGTMTDAGRVQIEAAKADGRWDRAYAGPATIEVPADLTEALAVSPAAQAWFAALTSSNRFAILVRIHEARRPETRARRITTFVEQLAQGVTPYPQKRRPDVGDA
ncbi:YdeI/OmpD-associated family protein [Sanguibacter antarcticus]|uniref:Uncharacterized protein YdeI (YjbR/CyaY-like superfamily) n=1 Tax=Sanguibacter antarcticus TaxID=372484 RepID=A0A2A9E5E3_9MICO|nr:YdeI/OmpD-associated family protein [Sanguibacter antarcticus]PFG34063.1 uncharacterized protein YdeI (YjbR/CyaY-like superfamily) [Sanguibacter antarcticus]